MAATRAHRDESRPFNGVKVFSATMLADRSRLGETVSAWIAAHASFKITDIVVTQLRGSAIAITETGA